MRPEQYTPLSQSQLNIYRLEMANPGIPINNICCTLKISGRVDVQLLQKSIAAMVRAFPILNTRICLIDGAPRQYQIESAPVQYPYYDFTATGQEGAFTWDIAIAKERMTLLDSPLFTCRIYKTSDTEGGVLMKTHHIISDAWSQMMMSNAIGDNYLSLLTTGEVLAMEVSPPYSLHVAEEEKYLRSPEHERDVQYWRERLQSLQPPHRAREMAFLSPIGRRKSFPLSERLNRAITGYCQSKKVSPFAVFYMALAIYLRRVEQRERICVGVPIVNRRTFSDKRAAGMFVNTLPFLTELDDSISFDQFNTELMRNWYGLLRHQRLPYNEIRELADVQGALFDIALSYQNGRMYVDNDARITFEGRWHYSGYQSEALCIHLSSREQDGTFLVDYDYLVQLFTAREIESMHHHLLGILDDALRHPEKPIYQLSLFYAPEEERVLFEFNRTKKRFLSAPNLKEQLASAAAGDPNRVAVICAGARLRYGELIERGSAIAGQMQSLLGDSRQIIAIAMPRDERLFLSMAGALFSSNAYLLIDPAQPDARIRDLVNLSGAQLLLAEDKRLLALDSLNCPALSLDTLAGYAPSNKELPPATENDLAYLVYTSGSSGAPKAVEITHGSTLNFCHAMAPLFGRSAVLSLCAVSFDAFVIESLCALVNAKTIVLASDAQRNDPQSLAKLIADYDVGFFALTPSRLSSYLRNPAFARSIHHMESIICGGEYFPGELYLELRERTGARIINQYGPSEATVGVSYAVLRGSEAITIGKPMANCTLYILNEHMQPQPVGAPGEIYIGGACLARGYRFDPELTAEKFLPDPFQSGGRLYKTGDMGRWNERGEILFMGRKDAQIKLNGHRIEPSEIEARLREHPDVEEAAVKLTDNHILAAYYSAARDLPGEELSSFIALSLPRYMLPAYYRQLPELPMTTSGKIDYRNLPAPEIQNDGALPETEAERIVLNLFKKALKNDGLTVTTDYFVAGGDSLIAIELFMDIEAVFGRMPELIELYANSTPRALARLMDKGEKAARAATIPRAETMPHYPLSPAQENFYVLSRLDPTGVNYNMPGAFAPSRPIDADALEMAIQRAIAADELLRTGFTIRENHVVQTIAAQAPFALDRLTGENWREAFSRFVRPFDLSVPPLLRAAVFQDPSGAQVLFFDMHHIISDGLSTALFMKRIGAYYAGEAPAMPPIRYIDYAVWRRQLKDAALDRQRAYWREKMENAPEILSLEKDAAAQAFDGIGERLAFSLPKRLSEALDGYCRREQITPYMLLITVYGLVLSAYARQKSFFIGTPVSGRNLKELNELTGAFVTTLPVRITTGDEPLSACLARVKNDVLSILDNQDIPFEEILSMYGGPREVGRNPLYSIMFSMRPIDASAFVFGEASLKPLETGARAAKLDLSLEAAQSENGYQFSFEYAASLFTEDTIALYARGFIAALGYVLEHDNPMVRDIPVLSARDTIDLIERPAALRAPYDASAIDQIIDRNALYAPDAPAIEWGDGQQMTFLQLRQRSDAIAARLIARGVGVGDRVALLARRDGDLLPAMLGVLKAGAAYVPLDSAYPGERILYILGDTGAKALLHTEGMPLPADLPCPALAIGEGEPLAFTPPTGRANRDAMYILYTSGSTGQPKGVVVPHRAMSNLLFDARALIDFENAKALCTANVIFDIFATETWLPLALGKCVVMADEEEMLLPWRMSERMLISRANILQLTPSRMQMCLGDASFRAALGQMALVLLIGEPWGRQMLTALQSAGARRIVNLYGPTEATVHAGWADLTGDTEVHFGKPIPNCRFYALDENQRPVPPAARGELYIAGECVADGYLNRPELTESVFLPDPFFPGERMYRTGDIVRQRADGNWVFLGRRDRQIKLNGHRVELDEIANTILASGFAKEVALTLEQKDGNYTAVHAFLVPEDNYSKDALRAHLRPVMPEYMIPSTFTPLGAMPRTNNGKTDLVALTKMQGNAHIDAAESADAKKSDEQPAQVESASPAPEDVPEATAARQDKPEGSSVPKAAAIEPAPSALPENENPDNAHPGSDTPAMSAASPTDELSSDADASPSAAEPGAEDLDNLLLTIWQEALGRDHIDPALSFFEQSGSSLSALVVLNRYYQLGYNLSMADFYRQPTLAAQARILAESSQTPETEKAVSATPPQEKPISNPDIRPETQPAQPTPKPPSPQPRPKLPAKIPSGQPIAERDGHLLLTGATGYLGAHLLSELIAQGEKRLICLVRGGEERLETALEYYFGAGYARQMLRNVVIVTGDIARDLFGLNATDYNKLLDRVSAIYHAAADVRHYVSDTSLERTNVEGTARIVDFARAADAVLYHISTASVCGETVGGQREIVEFTEQDLDIGQNLSDNAYVFSKARAEALVIQAMAKGLLAQILRVGRLVGRMRDGVFQRNPLSNASFRTIGGLLLIGAAPESWAEKAIEVTPVDICAQSIARLRGKATGAYHILCETGVPLTELAPVAIVPDGEFRALLKAPAARDENGLVNTVAEFYFSEAFLTKNVRITNRITKRALGESADLWKKPDPRQIAQCFADLIPHGAKDEMIL